MKYIFLSMALILLPGSYAQTIELDTTASRRTHMSLEQEKKRKELIDRLMNNPNSMKPKDTTIKDITGLAFGVGESASIPVEFSQPAAEGNWDPTSMTYEEMEKEAKIYYRKKYLRWGYIGIGICALIGAFFFIRKLMK